MRKHLTLAFGVLCISAQAVAAENVWSERWIQGYLGESINTPFTSSESGIEGMYEFKNQIYVGGTYHVSKERSGGTDNNALYSYSTVIQAGYTFNLMPQTKLQLGYGYMDVNMKNKQMGGVRVGTYADFHVYGSGPLLRVVHKLTNNLAADLMVARVKYTTNVTNTNSRVGLSYDVTKNVYSRFDFNSVDRADYSGARWSLGLGYRF